MQAPSVLIIPCSKLPKEFVLSPYLNCEECGILISLLAIGKVGENGVPFSLADVKSADSKSKTKQLWTRLLDRGFIEETVACDAITGRLVTKYTICLDESLLKEYTPKIRERTAKPDITKALSDILTRLKTGEIDTDAAVIAIARVKKVKLPPRFGKVQQNHKA